MYATYHNLLQAGATKPEMASLCFHVQSHRPLVKSAHQKNNFLISQPKHMLWVLKRTVSIRRFF